MENKLWNSLKISFVEFISWNLFRGIKLVTLSRSRTARRNSYSKSDSIMETVIQNIWLRMFRRSSWPVGSWRFLRDTVLRDLNRFVFLCGSISSEGWRWPRDSDDESRNTNEWTDERTNISQTTEVTLLWPRALRLHFCDPGHWGYTFVTQGTEVTLLWPRALRLHFCDPGHRGYPNQQMWDLAWTSNASNSILIWGTFGQTFITKQHIKSWSSFQMVWYWMKTLWNVVSYWRRKKTVRNSQSHFGNNIYEAHWKFVMDKTLYRMLESQEPTFHLHDRWRGDDGLPRHDRLVAAAAAEQSPGCLDRVAQGRHHNVLNWNVGFRCLGKVGSRETKILQQRSHVDVKIVDRCFERQHDLRHVTLSEEKQNRRYKRNIHSRPIN